MPTLKHLTHCPEPLQAQVRALIPENRLGEVLKRAIPRRTTVRTDEALQKYTLALKAQYMKSTVTSCKVLIGTARAQWSWRNQRDDPMNNAPIQTDATPVVRRLHALSDAQVAALADVLIDCVADGASVSFMHPLSTEKAQAFWRDVGHAVARGERALWVAEDEDDAGIVGTVQLVLGQPENQPHRADVSKLLVHQRARRLGLGAALMHAAEHAAREAGKTLLVLDTASDEAARLYSRLGWQVCGVVPNFALWPHGGLCATTFFYRQL
jgi:GNAT superfamily N-acetyltransferase